MQHYEGIKRVVEFDLGRNSDPVYTDAVNNDRNCQPGLPATFYFDIAAIQERIPLFFYLQQVSEIN
jgi:hypothetical protein